MQSYQILSTFLYIKAASFTRPGGISAGNEHHHSLKNKTNHLISYLLFYMFRYRQRVYRDTEKAVVKRQTRDGVNNLEGSVFKPNS